MESVNNPVFWQWFVETIAAACLAGALVGVAIGIGLIVDSPRMMRLFDGINRWVSMRPATRSLEIPRDTTAAVQRNRRWLAAVFIAGGAFATFVLALRYDADAITYSLGLQSLHPVIVSWSLAATRWTLIVCNVAAIVVGVLLAFFPGALRAIEVHADRWYSQRQLMRTGDAMHLPLERLIAAAPRAAGAVLALGSAIALVSVGTLLARHL